MQINKSKTVKFSKQMIPEDITIIIQKCLIALPRAIKTYGEVSTLKNIEKKAVFHKI